MKRLAGALLLAAVGLSFCPADDGALAIELVDEAGKPVRGVVSVSGPDGKVLPLPELQARGLGLPEDKAIFRWRVPRGITSSASAPSSARGLHPSAVPSFPSSCNITQKLGPCAPLKPRRCRIQQ